MSKSENHPKFVYQFFKKMRPDSAIKFIRKIYWKSSNELTLMRSIIDIKNKNNISLEEAFNQKFNQLKQHNSKWHIIREEAESYIKELGIDIPRPKITTTITDGSSTETTETLL